jgi:hypothetical protein
MVLSQFSLLNIGNKWVMIPNEWILALLRIDEAVFAWLNVLLEITNDCTNANHPRFFKERFHGFHIR